MPKYFWLVKGEGSTFSTELPNIKSLMCRGLYSPKSIKLKHAIFPTDTTYIFIDKTNNKMKIVIKGCFLEVVLDIGSYTYNTLGYEISTKCNEKLKEINVYSNNNIEYYCSLSKNHFQLDLISNKLQFKLLPIDNSIYSFLNINEDCFDKLTSIITSKPTNIDIPENIGLNCNFVEKLNNFNAVFYLSKNCNVSQKLKILNFSTKPTFEFVDSKTGNPIKFISENKNVELLFELKF